MAGTTTTVVADEDSLNVLSTASEGDIAEIERLLEPDDGKGKVVGEGDEGDEGHEGEGDEVHEGDEGDEGQRGKVDEELSEARTEADREAIRERRRQERRAKRDRQRDKVESLERQVENERAGRLELANRLAALENNNTGTQYASLKEAEKQADQAISKLTAQIADATTKQDGERAAAATNRLLEAREVRGQIIQARTDMERRAQQQQAPQGRSSLSKEALGFADEFMTRNKWYKGPQSDDLDSQILSTVDRKLLDEGWNPNQKGYWDELDKRKAAYLPHRVAKNPPEGGKPGYNAADGGTQRSAQRSPVVGSSGGSSGGGGGKKTYRLNSDRVRAMKEAGLWDDPKKRDSAIARYRKYDEEHQDDK